MGQQEWLDNFKQQNGREPSLEEFAKAKQSGFKFDGPASAGVNDLKAWVQIFENRYHRKPSLEEVQQHKAAMRNQETHQQRPSTSTSASATNHHEKTAPAQSQRTAASGGNTQVKRPSGVTAGKMPAKPRKKKGLVIFLLALILLIFGAVLYGYRYFSYNNSLARTSTVLNSYDSNQYRQVTQWSDNSQKLSADELKPLANYIKDQDMSKSELSSWIKGSGKGVSFVQDGHNWLIFPRYVLKVTPISLEVNTNQSGLTVTVNDQTITDDSSSDYSKVLKRQAPGLYQFSAKGQVDGHKVKAQNNGYYGSVQYNRIDLDVKRDSSGDSSKNKLSNDTATDILRQMADLLSSKGNASSSSIDTDTVFQGGDDNHAYKDFSEMIDHNLHSAKRNADNIRFSSVKVNQLDSQSDNKADVKFEMTEDFYYSSDTDSDKRTSGTLTQRYGLIAHMVYNKDKDRWLVDSIDSNQTKLSQTDNVK